MMVILEEIYKTAYIQCIIDTASELHRIATNISSDMDMVISCAKNELNNLDDVKNTAKKVLTVFLSSEEIINTARHNFLHSYHQWLEDCLKVNAVLLENTILKEDENTKSLPSFKSIHDKYIIEIEDLYGSDIEIVNEVRYSKSRKTDNDSNEDEEIASKSSEKESNNAVFINKSKKKKSTSPTSIQNESIIISDDSIVSDENDLLSKKNECFNSSIDSVETYFSPSVCNSNVAVPTNTNFLSDSNCVVVLERLSEENYKYKKESLPTKNKKFIDEYEFARLINLDDLEKPRNKRCYIFSDESSTNESSNSSSPSLSNNYKVKRKNKKFKTSSSISEVSSFYSSSDDNSEKRSTNNNYYAYNNDLNVDKLLIEQNEESVKQQLLRSDDSTDFELDQDDSNDNDENSRHEKKKNKIKEAVQNLNSDTPGSDDDRRVKPEWTKDKVLNFKLNDLDINEKKKTGQNAIPMKADSDSDNDLKPIIITKRRNKRNRLNVSQSLNSTDKSSLNNSFSDGSDSEDCQIVRSSSQLSATSQVTGILTNSEEKVVVSNAVTPSKPAGRRNIRKVFHDEEVAEGTRRAGKDEENRLQRLAERKKQLQELLTEKNKEKDTLVLDFDIDKKVDLIKVDRGLVKFLKPHQAEGVKFMWESCFETLEQVKNSEGSGCILAHCMGLGKTFQIVTLVHTILVNRDTGVNTVMVVCPMNTILNWVEEFDMWLKHAENNKRIRVYDLTQIKKTSSRISQLKFWHDLGGVLVLSYEMFRLFTSDDKKQSLQRSQKMRSYLLNPGADFVVCDEGHLLKNEGSQIAKRMQCVRTKRRVILTGTPLQNNLSEYHCMVQFVKPNLLGNKIEFLNRFGNPIVNGQFDNSTAKDVKLMKHRAHVLHRMLEGCVQRCDYAVLTPFLPPKQEYVILLRLSELQIEMYRFFIENIARADAKHCRLFKNYHEIKRLIAHPTNMQLQAKANQKNNKSNKNNKAKNLRNGDFSQAEEEYWWSRFVKDDQRFDFTQSYKLIFLYGILERCKKEGDKILLFSQCLNTLDLIEIFLKHIDSQSKQNGFTNDLFNFQDEWKRGLDYFRMDGSVNSEKRNSMCKTFNNPNNKRARLFLISTRAGGLGINLIGANRVVIFDPSWNPSNDLQSIFRIFRFGQSKPCYIYRFLSAGTMEQKIYNRQVTKLSLSLRVLDEHQIERHYRDTELAELYKLETLDDQPILNVPKDHVLADVFLKFKNYVYQFFEHDSLLENKEEEELDEDERKQAWFEYQEEKQSQLLKANQKKRVPEKISEQSTTSAENLLPPAAVADPTVDDIILPLPNLY
ncbi:transcriptional regulator ATRX homolog [Nasonia vitripennis]|uniref:Transcriptional regulator ATRX-like protein n=1 Tax=Nasonia vitripennis TaxID=7425 RepID=A0A7M7IX45_NASVI|nr:transcriptional regulator ATRX homolog [Nasonia vitripennis]